MTTNASPKSAWPCPPSRACKHALPGSGRDGSRGFSADPLTDIRRSGARRLIAQAGEAELAVLLAVRADDKTEDGRSRVIRHGYLPEREVMTGIGPVPVKVPGVRDRAAGAEKVRFTSSNLPPYLRKAKSVEELLPWLYLKGISSGDFQEALAALLGPNAAGLSSTTISQLKAAWWGENERWQRRDLGARRIVHIWADGVYFQPRMAEEKQCVPVVIGADEWGRKEVLGVTDGDRESTQSWRELLIDLKRLDLKRRGLTRAPELAIHCPAGDLRRKSAERRRRRPRFPGGAARGGRQHARATLLAPQDRQYSERDAEIRAAEGQGPSARHLAGRDQG